MLGPLTLIELLARKRVVEVIPTTVRDRTLMTDTNARKRAESLFDRETRREAEIADALKQEQARHDAAIRNMRRLRALRLSRDVKNTA